ncbi:multiple sugar transport system permease protein/raffinose/stachyose/melibiose transport system permease protein [Nonomuraea solani]|uniref:Multiple sugar transport system permease protein/raffinose/stachyose/melibiose transport system permease protein n=1 Tax=Nonomuraea solani TaxID=1144553 RepID=A0A1H6E2Z1_9ACTN|nr:sugar ABC transporter permease [Nonomuraea solani]SEG91992.1 multiple sugar transport system permease protein/raffinose/stachyose/melibiose transport system permease protein [Nonomuraea solani]
MTSATLTRGAVTEKPKTGAKVRRGRVGLLYVLPFFVSFVLFLLWPTVYGIWMSFTDRDLAAGTEPKMVGFANYAEALTDPMVWTTFGNTVLFTVLTTVPLILLALVAALLVNLGLPGQWVWRMSFFLPYLLASTVVSLIWKWLYNPELGLVNSFVALFGVEAQKWLQDPDTAMVAIALTTTWWTLGFNFLLYLAALQNIPATVYEAASIDGAGKWRQLFSITLPLLRNTTMLILVLQILASLKVFDQIYQMSGGGPDDSTRSVLMYVFDTGFTGYRLGYASAISYVFFAIILVLSLLQLRFARRSDR